MNAIIFGGWFQKTSAFPMLKRLGKRKFCLQNFLLEDVHDFGHLGVHLFLDGLRHIDVGASNGHEELEIAVSGHFVFFLKEQRKEKMEGRGGELKKSELKKLIK